VREHQHLALVMRPIACETAGAVVSGTGIMTTSAHFAASSAVVTVTVAFSLAPGLARERGAHLHLDAAVFQIQRVRVPCQP
jgi:hypothetical protein